MNDHQVRLNKIISFCVNLNLLINVIRCAFLFKFYRVIDSK